MKFCFVIPPDERYTATTGGAIATVTHELARVLIRDGHQVDIITPSGGGAIYTDGSVHILKFGKKPTHVQRLINRVLGRSKRWSWAAGSARYVRECVNTLQRLGAVDGNSSTVIVLANDPSFASYLARRGANNRTAVWLHNYLYPPQGDALVDLPNGATIIAVSESVRSWTAEVYGLTHDRIIVINNGVDADAFHPRSDFTAPTFPVRIVCHGRIDPNKGQLLAANAVAELRDRGHKVTLTLIGSVKTFGMSQDQVDFYVQELDRAVARVGATMVGRIPTFDVPGILRQFDIACQLPAADEPFSLAALESMASGCAIVAIPRGGLAEVVNGAAILTTDTTGGVADALAYLVEHPAELASAKVAARRRALELTWTPAAKALVDVFGIDPK